MTMFRILIGVLGLAFGALIVWALQEQSFREQGAWLLQHRWGLVTLGDLYLGFLITAGLIVALESNKLTGAAWALGVVVMGNIVTAAWIVLRLPKVLARLR